MPDWKPPLMGNKQPRKYGPPDPRLTPKPAEQPPPPDTKDNDKDPRQARKRK